VGIGKWQDNFQQCEHRVQGMLTVRMSEWTKYKVLHTYDMLDQVLNSDLKAPSDSTPQKTAVDHTLTRYTSISAI